MRTKLRADRCCCSSWKARDVSGDGGACSIHPRRAQTRVRRTCDRPGCDSRPRETRQGITLTIAVNLSEQAAAWSAHDALADRLYREGDFLFESVDGACSENRGGSLLGGRMVATPGERREHGPVIAKASLNETVSAEEALRRFGGLRPARSARRSRPSPWPLHRARPKGRRSRPPGLPPSGSGSLSTCP